ncbi:MAG: MMPL family transporter, partial [Alphaproteobacteria bacterium]
ITILLLALLRNAIDTALVLSPLILAGLMTGALVVVLGLKFNFANIIVIPLLFGLGVASGIYLVTRARRENTVNLLQTVTARAIMFSALTTVSSFGSLAISSHRGTASMGELLLIAIVLSLLCSLIVLPALLQIVVDRRARRAGRPRHERPSP